MDGVDVIVLAEALIAFAVFLLAAKARAKTACVIAFVVCFIMSFLFAGVMLAKNGVIS